MDSLQTSEVSPGWFDSKDVDQPDNDVETACEDQSDSFIINDQHFFRENGALEPFSSSRRNYQSAHFVEFNTGS